MVDEWGRLHAVETNSVIGRSSARASIVVLDSGVSRAHARLWREVGRWRVRDLESANGTTIDGLRITDRELRHGECLRVASIGLGVVIGFATAAPSRPVELATRQQTPLEREAAADNRSPVVSIHGATGGGGGVVQVEHARAKLSGPQLQLIEVLAKQMLADSDRPEPVRGFVRSAELIRTLSWSASEPEDNIKKLVRRVRRRLMELGLGDLIEARRGLGYRLRLAPDALRASAV